MDERTRDYLLQPKRRKGTAAREREREREKLGMEVI